MTEAEKLIQNDQTGKILGKFGSEFPVVSINNYTFNENELIHLSISCIDWIPVVNLTVKTLNGIFLTRHFPKDGDLISVFIRSSNNLFKPIKMDFLITEINTSYSRDREGSEMTYYFTGFLRIPNFYADWCVSYPEMSSVEVMIEIANKFGLGFVSNEVSTEDTMTWINPTKPVPLFIQDLVKHAYKDENSFFDSWIDVYYNLNFMNMNKMFIVPDDLDIRDGLLKGNWTSDNRMGNNSFEITKNILTNSSEAADSNFYFNSFQLGNFSGLITSLFGYKKKLHFYDFALKEKVDFSLMAMKTQNAEKSKNILLGRVGEDYYKKDVKSKWLGLQFSKPYGNVHNFYKMSEVQNIYNNLEIKKINVLLQLPNCNFNIYKGQVLPVMFIVQDDIDMLKVAGNVEDDSKRKGQTMDRTMSGNYVVMGYEIIYNQKVDSTKGQAQGTFSQEIILSRREWSAPNSDKWQKNDDPVEYSKKNPL
jgi:hypothetical protein